MQPFAILSSNRNPEINEGAHARLPNLAHASEAREERVLTWFAFKCVVVQRLNLFMHASIAS